MVRPLLLSAGSRGDFEPILALAESPDFEDPVLFVQPEYQALAPRAHILPVSLEDILTSLAHAMSLATPNETYSEITGRAFGHACANFILPSVDAVLEVTQSTSVDVVLSTQTTWMIAHIVAEKLRVPLVLVSFQPSLRSRFVPPLLIRPLEAAIAFEKLLKGVPLEGDDENLAIFSQLHECALTAFLEPLNAHRVRLGLAPMDKQRAADIGEGCSDVPTLVACSPRLTPAPPDWNPMNKVVGSLAPSFKPKSYNPEQAHPELCEFLNNGPPPVVVSYGSMGSMTDSRKLTFAVLSGLRDADVRRIVIVPGNARLDGSLLDQKSDLAAWARGRVFTVRESVQYSYLLPRASLFLCHGGAGSVMAALHAGTPVVITPEMVDQPFFAELVSRLGLGAATPQGLDNLQPEMLTPAVHAALSDEVVKNVRKFAEKEQNAVSPVTLVARTLEQIVEDARNESNL